MKLTESHIGIIIAIIALQILPISDAIAKYLSGALPILQIIWARFFFHCLITGVLSGYLEGWRYVLPTMSLQLILQSTALFMAVALFYVTIQYIPLTTGLTLWFIEPFILTVLAKIFFNERVNFIQWVAIFISFAGICLVIKPVYGEFHWAYVTGLGAGLAYAVFLLLTRVIDAKTPPISTVFQTGLIGCIATSIFVVPGWETPSTIDWVYFLLIGGLAALAHFLLIRAFVYANASTIAPFTYSEIIMAIILGYLVFGDIPDFWSSVGLIIIISSALMIFFVKPKNEKPAKHSINQA